MNYEDNFYKKYIKYKYKYLQKINSLKGGGRYDCVPENKYKDICVEKENGKYRSKESCVNDCEVYYVRNELKKVNIDKEASKFYLFIKDIIKTEKVDVYLKGGNVLGLKVLKMIYDKYKNNDNKFRAVFMEFLKLELIKDWDFAGYTREAITSEYREKFDNIAKQYRLHQRATKFILYQTEKPILLEEKPLFEIAILDSDSFSKLEIPLTTMKVRVTEYNVKYVFMLCKLFYSYKENGEDFDFDILRRILEKIQVIIYPHKNGLYNVTNNFDKGGLNNKILEFIKPYEDFDKNLPQFLATHIEDPFRILYRLPEKNIPKNDRVKKFIQKHLTNSNQEWLFDSAFITKITKLFCENLGAKLLEIYKDEYIKTFDIKKSIEHVNTFLSGVSFGRIEVDYKMLTDNGKTLLSLLFSNLIKEIDKKNINEIGMELKIFKFMRFLVNKTNIIT